MTQIIINPTTGQPVLDPPYDQLVEISVWLAGAVAEADRYDLSPEAHRILMDWCDAATAYVLTMGRWGGVTP